jgi:hypothetical protein
MNKREAMKVSKSLQSRTHENDKRILDAASSLRDGALGRCIRTVFYRIYSAVV